MSRDLRDDEPAEPLPSDRADGSTELDMRETFQVLFNDPAVRNFVFAGLGALGMIFLILFQQGSDIGGLMIVISASAGFCSPLDALRPRSSCCILTVLHGLPVRHPRRDAARIVGDRGGAIPGHRHHARPVAPGLHRMPVPDLRFGLAGDRRSRALSGGSDEKPTRRPPALIRPSELGILLGVCAALTSSGKSSGGLRTRSRSSPPRTSRSAGPNADPTEPHQRVFRAE